MENLPKIIDEMEKIKTITNGYLVSHKLGGNCEYFDRMEIINNTCNAIQREELRKNVRSLIDYLNNVVELRKKQYKNIIFYGGNLQVSGSIQKNCIKLIFISQTFFICDDSNIKDSLLTFIYNKNIIIDRFNDIVNNFFGKINQINEIFVNKYNGINSRITIKKEKEDVFIFFNFVQGNDIICDKKIKLIDFFNCDVNEIFKDTYIDEEIKNKELELKNKMLMLNKDIKDKLNLMQNISMDLYNCNIDKLDMINKDLKNILDKYGGNYEI